MNNKGQFYIIAALLVLVVIMATVVTTYNALRYDSSISNTPQLLSAVDETNLALKQLLGFTVGYYGSIMRVTGNTSYAQNLAKLYLQSGLENIADMKPEWGLSFNITDVDLHLEWYLPTSNSSGQFSISYDLPGLGFYNLTCTIQNILNVQVLSSVSDDEARISINKENDEPVTVLSMNNFKFYSFDIENQTWAPVSPTVEPVVFANGTYSINVPPDVVTTSYMVQVKDNRGISVFALSCSRYVVALNWTTSGGGEVHYVDNNNSNVEPPANTGFQSNFIAQQAGPDPSYDTLTEENTGGEDTNTPLINGESFEGTFPPTGWNTTGSYWSRTSNQRYDGSYSAYFDGRSGRTGTLTSPSVNCSGATAVYVDFWYRDAGCETGNFLLQYYDGSNWDTTPSAADLGANQSTSGWLHYQQKITDSQYFKSNFAIRISMDTDDSGDDAYVDLFTVIKEVSSSNYTLDIEEQWTNVDMTNPLQKLCIKTGTLGNDSLKVDVWDNNTWVNLINGLVASAWNNVSVNQYLWQNFTIRFRSNETSDHTQTLWAIDAVLLQPQSGLGDMLAQQKDSTVAVEWLQNGTMRVLGQNLQLSSEMPIPPVSAKGFHLNQTIDGVDQEVPFQIEDWASEYRVPLGLTNNMTVFSNRQMLVFLLSRNVTQVTLWWNGSDTATQTPLAYTNKYFTSDTVQRTVNNGIVNLKIDFSYQEGVESFKVISTKSGSTATAVFMRINQKTAHYGSSEPTYAVLNGTVRAVLHHEVEWRGDGISGCPNVYAHIVLTLPANATYYTYQLRLMFVNSTGHPRTITDLCPIKLSTTLSPITIQTEDGTIDNVTTGTGTFSNYTSGGWTAHHWSQINSTSGAGAGILFTDTSNILLYAFDSIAGNSTGALKTDTSTKIIELDPVVSLYPVNSFTSAMDITWKGAIATFDSSSTPIYYLNGGSPAGLWILAEFQPQITVTAEI